MSIEAEIDEAFLKRMSRSERDSWGRTSAIARIYEPDFVRLLALAERGAKVPDEKPKTLQELQDDYLKARDRLAHVILGDQSKGVTFPSTALGEKE